jgi:hypothetical protein
MLSSGWVDHVCIGPCKEFFDGHPTVKPWRAAIVLYLAVSLIVVLVLLYKSIVRRISKSPEAPLAPKEVKERVKERSPVKVQPMSPKAAPKSPKSRVVKKTVAVVEAVVELVPEPTPASPKARRARKSLAGEAAEAVAPRRK